MNKLQTKIMSMDFQKTAKRFILLSIIIVIFGGVLTGFMFRTQISEVITYHQTYENSRQNGETKDNGENERYEGENRKERERGHDYEEADFFESGQFTRPTVGAQIAFLTYAGLGALIALSYWLLVTAWLYQSASKAFMNRTLWTILGLFFNLAAVIAFLVARSQQTVCSSCGTYQKSAAFCRACGTPLQIKCTECGTLAESKDNYCSHCGNQIGNNGTSKTK